LEVLLVAAAVASGVLLRIYKANELGPMWCDEAESSINALTILQHGYPVDHYLGIPIYENTLIRPWPENPELEFKDLSYSARGLAIYHGWLPLYSMAASFALHGIRPDQPGSPPRYDLDEYLRRTWAGRLPALVFGALFLIVCYIAGKSMYGRDAGITALVAAIVLTTHIDISSQARYYSALTTLSTLSLLMTWLVLTKGRWKHYIGGAAVLLALFYTHLVTFAAATLVFGAVALCRRPEASIGKLAAAGAIVAAGAAPWLIATGFLSEMGHLPPARLYLSFPRDLWTFPPGRAPYLAIFAAFALLLVYAAIPGSRLPASWRDPLRKASVPMLLLACFTATVYLAFFFFIPSPSFDPERLKLGYWGPVLLLSSIVCTVIARDLSRRFPAVIAPPLALALIVILPAQAGLSDKQFGTWADLTTLIEHLGNLTAPHTRFYAAPNAQLILAFYTGVPFQSVAPVRKSFLDAYPGDIVYIDQVGSSFLSLKGPAGPRHLREAAIAAGQDPGEEAVRAVASRLRTADYRAAAERRIGGSDECLREPEMVPAYARPLFEAARTEHARVFSEQVAQWPILRGLPVKDWPDWLGYFFYRYVDPYRRTGPGLNYGERLRGSTADVLAGAGWVIYRSPGGASHTGRITFRIHP
jgi:hypothetical protein